MAIGSCCRNRLPLLQEELKIEGHAFEARIYAENTDANFLPDTGKLVHVALPPTTTLTHSNTALASRTGGGEVVSAAQGEAVVRVDTGFVSGDEISVHYDPMIAKLIVKGRDRTEALRIMANALNQYQVVGPQTNIQFLKNLVRHPKFIAGEVETGFIGKYGESGLFGDPYTKEEQLKEAVAQGVVWLYKRDLEASKKVEKRKVVPRKASGPTPISQSPKRTFAVNHKTLGELTVSVVPSHNATFNVTIHPSKNPQDTLTFTNLRTNGSTTIPSTPSTIPSSSPPA